MNSNRMRLFTPIISENEGLSRNFFSAGSHLPLALESLPAPLPVQKIHPDQLIEDILVATLRRVQEDASPEVSAAASRYISLLSENTL